MLRRFSIVLLSSYSICCWTALAAADIDRQIILAALRETRDIISRELFGHYDVLSLKLLTIGPVGDQAGDPDYGLVKATLQFSTRRNETRNPSLNREMFGPGSEMCRDWLYLHCGVPTGHIFEGKMEILLAIDRNGAWRAVSPHWRSRTLYPLHGYLLFEGKDKEGYVLFPQE
jgi:hypothetical protein